MTPARLVSPRVVRIVASDAKPLGFDSELQVSVPNPRAARLVATAVALPPLDPAVRQRRVVGVADGAADRADAEVAERELVEVRLAEDHRAAGLHAGGHARVEARTVIAKRQRAAGRRQIGRVDVVLEHDRHAVEGPEHAARGAHRIAGPRVGDRARVERQQALNVGPWRS